MNNNVFQVFLQISEALTIVNNLLNFTDASSPKLTRNFDYSFQGFGSEADQGTAILNFKGLVP